jgi:hypothetical protein
MRGDAGITGDNEFCIVIKDGLQGFDVDAVIFLAADRNVIHYICSERSQGLHQQSRGGLSIHVEIAPDANALVAPDRGMDGGQGIFDIRERRGGQRLGMEKGPGGVGSQNPAADEGLRDERRQVEGGKRRCVYWKWVKPASHGG